MRQGEKVKSLKQIEDNRAEEQAILSKKRSATIAAINNIFTDNDGQMFLKHLHDICGYAKPNCIANAATGDPQPEFSFYNEGRRSIYLEIRSLLYPETLRQAFQGQE